jgi:hypothetical protein
MSAVHKPGLRAAVNSKCRECIVDMRPGNGRWRQQVEACTAPDCPLYPVRPRAWRASAAKQAEKAVFETAKARLAPTPSLGIPPSEAAL